MRLPNSNWSDPNAPSGPTHNGWLLRTAGFGENFVVTNPQLSSVTVNGNRGCSNYHVILQNPKPRTRGNFGYNRFYNAGTWNADMALSKSARLGESKSIQIRVDATNIFNHPTPAGSATQTTPGARTYYASPPAYKLSGGATYAGDLNSKVGQRPCQARIRFNLWIPQPA